jgi:putative addiction module component (TIGR02574 family)
MQDSASQELLKLVELRKDLQVGIDQLEAGDYTKYTEESLDDFFEEIKRDGQQELELSQSLEVINDWHKQELDCRQAAYEANPEPLSTWEEVQANIIAKYR